MNLSFSDIHLYFELSTLQLRPREEHCINEPLNLYVELRNLMHLIFNTLYINLMLLFAPKSLLASRVLLECYIGLFIIPIILSLSTQLT